MVDVAEMDPRERRDARTPLVLAVALLAVVAGGAANAWLARLPVSGSAAAAILAGGAAVWGVAALALARASAVHPLRRVVPFGVARAWWSVPWALAGAVLLAEVAPMWLDAQRGWWTLPTVRAQALDASALPLGVKVALIAGVVVCAEEAFFRGALTHVFARFGDVAAWLVPAAAFALVHGAPERMPWLFALGLALGFARHLGAGLTAPLALHALYNALLVAGSGPLLGIGAGHGVLALGIWLACGIALARASRARDGG